MNWEWLTDWPAFVGAAVVAGGLWIAAALFVDKWRSQQMQSRIEMRRVSTPAGVPVIPGPDPLLTEADFERVYAYLAEQRREGSQ